MKKTILSFSFLYLSFNAIIAQSFNKEKLDSLFNAIYSNNKGMGSITLSKNDSIIYNKVFGYSLISDKDKISLTTKTKYRIGSISKVFTATLIFQLIEEDRIKLSDKLSLYFPAIPNSDKITISNLLNHRSGLYDFTDDTTFLTWMVNPKTKDEMINLIKSKSPLFEPDTKASYSNSNYTILGYIIEKIYKKSYGEVLKEQITSKIGLTNTYYGGKTNIKNDEAFSYKFNQGNWVQEPESDASISIGCGAILSTPSDLNKFIEALFSYKLVNKNSLNQMETIKDGYGMGLIQVPFYIKRGYGYTGSIDGFSSLLVYFPDDSLTVSICFNGLDFSRNKILIGVLNIYYNLAYILPDFKTNKEK